MSGLCVACVVSPFTPLYLLNAWTYFNETHSVPTCQVHVICGWYLQGHGLKGSQATTFEPDSSWTAEEIGTVSDRELIRVSMSWVQRSTSQKGLPVAAYRLTVRRRRPSVLTHCFLNVVQWIGKWGLVFQITMQLVCELHYNKIQIAFAHHVTAQSRTNEVYLPMNGMNNDWLPVEAEAHQSWPPKTVIHKHGITDAPPIVR